MGVVGYACDRDLQTAVFALGADAYVVDIATGSAQRLDVPGPVVDPRLDPTGRRVAYVHNQALRVVEVARSAEGEVLAADDDPDVTWGLPDFIAGEEMHRLRGYWWSPDGERIVAARVDNRPVHRWYISNPADPASEPVLVRYPAAGTPNADVSLHLLTLAGEHAEVSWDRTAFPYLAEVVWSQEAPLTVVVQSRDQRTVRVLTVADDATTAVAAELTDDSWVELIPGAPRWSDGRLVTVADDREADTRRIFVDGAAITPPGLQVRRLAGVDDSAVTFLASQGDPTAVRVWSVRSDGSQLHAMSPDAAVADASAAAGVTVVVTRSMDAPGATTVIHHPRGETGVASHADSPDMRLNITLSMAGERGLATALLLPPGRASGDGGRVLPVLLDPYGGPHAQRVVRVYNAFLSSQWFADQGFAVLVADGRGSPGRGPTWERAVAGDLATPPLEDQVDALNAVAAEHPGLLDLSKVAIRGWSFGGFLAALAVLRRPDVFAAAIAGAPVTEQALYDTHYTERYLGLPHEEPEAYRHSSLLEDAPRLDRPLLMIHGLADDNVVAAHTLRLSRALLEAGRPHTVLPLTGVTHMAAQESVAENLLLLQLDFLRRALHLETLAT